MAVSKVRMDKGKMKVLGLTFGRKLGNTEILVKEALMGAEEAGAEVELVRVSDLDLRPCTGCNECLDDLFEQGGQGRCAIEDGFGWLDARITGADGLVIGSPIYGKSPTGLFQVLADRMRPSHDLAFRMIARQIRAEKGLGPERGEKPFRPRFASLFAVGGSDWSEFALPMMQLFVMPLQVPIVDQQVFSWMARAGAAVLDEGMLARARGSGRHVAESLRLPEERVEYIGEPGICPICHSKLLLMDGSLFKANCATCGVRGSLKVEGDGLRFVVTSEEAARSQCRTTGMARRAEELRSAYLELSPDPEGIQVRIGKYRDYPIGPAARKMAVPRSDGRKGRKE